MKLARIGRDRWTVYAACRADGSCPLLQFISTLEARRALRIMRDLRTYVPTSDPGDWARTGFSASLAESKGIFEFRWPTGRGGTPRVFWFFDSGRVIVCSHGLDKKGAMSHQEIELAEQMRREYLAAKLAGCLQLVEPDNRNGP